MIITWLKRVLGIEPIEPAVEVRIFERRDPPKPKTQYRYTIQSGTYCRVLRVLAMSQKPMTAAEVKALLDTTTGQAIIGQMVSDGIVSGERISVGTRVMSYWLTDKGRQLADTVTTEALY